MNFLRKKQQSVDRLKFDEFFINTVNKSFCVWYAVNYKSQQAICIQYEENGVLVYQISWTAIDNATNKTQIGKSEFLEVYDRVVDYIKNARP